MKVGAAMASLLLIACGSGSAGETGDDPKDFDLPDGGVPEATVDEGPIPDSGSEAESIVDAPNESGDATQPQTKPDASSILYAPVLLPDGGYCGGHTLPCCDGRCVQGHQCARGTCWVNSAQCGGVGQPCCPGGTCSGSLTCAANGYCQNVPPPKCGEELAMPTTISQTFTFQPNGCAGRAACPPHSYGTQDYVWKADAGGRLAVSKAPYVSGCVYTSSSRTENYQYSLVVDSYCCSSLACSLEPQNSTYCSQKSDGGKPVFYYCPVDQNTGAIMVTPRGKSCINTAKTVNLAYMCCD